MEEREWVMLNFTLPKEPSRIRVSVWRKLKKSGSVSIGQSMWLLPLTNEHIETLTDIAQEILQNKGEAYILKAVFMTRDREDDVVAVFNKTRDEEYKELLDKCGDFSREMEKETAKGNFSFAEIEENEDEYNKLVAWRQKIAGRDFFHASLKTAAEHELNNCRQLLEDFSKKVYELNTDT